MLNSGANLLVDINNIIVGSTGGLYPNYNPNQYSTSGNLYSTGSLLLNEIISLSGQFLTSGTTYNLLSGNLGITGQTLYASDSIISGNVTNTGISLVNLINGLSGALNLSGASLTTSINNVNGSLINDIVSFSGQFLSSGTTYIGLSGNLNQTGINLINLAAGISGAFNQSGAVLLGDINQINTNSGNFTNLFYSTANPNNYINSGAVLTSGATFTVKRSGDFQPLFSIDLSGYSGNLGTVTIATGTSGIVFNSATKT